MFQLSILLSNHNQVISLVYDKKEKADSAAKTIARLIESGEKVITVDDDYAHSATFYAGSITTILLSNYDSDLNLQVDKKFLEARSQKKFENKVRTDPAFGLVGGMQ
jgi:hypothetical protein